MQTHIGKESKFPLITCLGLNASKAHEMHDRVCMFIMAGAFGGYKYTHNDRTHPESASNLMHSNYPVYQDIFVTFRIPNRKSQIF